MSEKILRLFRQAEVEGVRSFSGTDELFRQLNDNEVKIGVATGEDIIA